MKKILSALGLSVALALGGSMLITNAVAKPMHGGGGGGFGGGHSVMHMLATFADLDLTSEQRQQIKQIGQDAMANFAHKKGDRQEFRQELKDLIHSENFDEAAVKALIAEQQARHAEMILNMAKIRHQVWNILTPEQQAIIVSRTESNDESGHGKRGGHHGNHQGAEDDF